MGGGVSEWGRGSRTLHPAMWGRGSSSRTSPHAIPSSVLFCGLPHQDSPASQPRGRICSWVLPFAGVASLPSASTSSRLCVGRWRPTP